jgi:D-Tyr-tRNAtyr deacylase
VFLIIPNTNESLHANFVTSDINGTYHSIYVFTLQASLSDKNKSSIFTLVQPPNFTQTLYKQEINTSLEQV